MVFISGENRDGRQGDRDSRSIDGSEVDSRDEDSFDMCVVHQGANYVTYGNHHNHPQGHPNGGPPPIYLKSAMRKPDYMAARESPLGSSSRYCQVLDWYFIFVSDTGSLSGTPGPWGRIWTILVHPTLLDPMVTTLPFQLPPWMSYLAEDQMQL